MSVKANPTVVGGFILGAIALAATIAVIFGGGMFKPREHYVVFFEGSVSGLSIGAPVTLRGVPIGTVDTVRLDVDRKSMRVYIPVYISVDSGSITVIGLPPSEKGGVVQRNIAEAIRLGLRARLQTQSLVTGQVGIEFEFLPEVPPVLVGLDKSVTELPTAPSVIEALKQRLEKIPIDQLADKLLKTITDIDALVTSPEIRSTLSSVAGTGEAVRASVQNDIRPAVQTLTRTLANAQRAIDAIQALSNAAGTQLDASSQDLRKTLAALDQTIRQGQVTLGSINSMVQPNTSSRANIDQMLRDLAITAQSLKGLAEELERNPNALFLGKR